VKARFDIHKKLNKFLLDSYHHKKVSNEDEAFVKGYLEKNRLDEGQEIYLEKGNNSMLIHPFKKEEDIGIGRYFELRTYRRILNSAGYALIIFFALMLISFNLVKNNSAYLNWSSALYIINTNEIAINTNDIARIPLKIYYKDASFAGLANTLAEKLPAAFNVTTQQFGLSDTTSAAVFYFSKKHEKDALLAADVTGQLLEKNITPQFADSTNFATANADVVVYVNPGVTCTPLAISALPQYLSEIWHGGTSNRLININLSKKVMYYSVNDTKTFGTYNIDEICLTKDGAYKIITKSKQGYKLFFIRNANRQSFELSVCQNFVQSKTELENKDESYCDKFNKMTLYYTTDPAKIFLPVSGSTLVASEKTKLDKIDETIRNAANQLKTANYVMTLYSSTRYLNQSDKSVFPKILSGRGGSSINMAAISSPDPFQRNYLVFDFKKTEPVQQQQSQNASPKQPEQNQPPQQIPNCSVTYTSLEQVTTLSNPLIICKLDLSEAKLTSIPKELYTFKNMQELNLGVTPISKSEIEQLTKALPNCKISYIPLSSNPPATSKQTDLGDIYFEKNTITSSSRSTLQRIAMVLDSNKKASIVLEAEYNDSKSQKLLVSYVNKVTSYFYKMGLSEKSGQINQKISEAKVQQQQQQMKLSTPREPVIHITGINFPAGFSSSPNKSAD